MTPRKRMRAPRQARGSIQLRLDPAEVARVAYELFEQRGGSHGRDLEDWLEAEAIVQQRHAVPSGERSDFL